MFDTDRSGKISFTEFLLATSIPRTNEMTADHREQLETLFQLYDTNGDGYIDRREMKHFLETLCESEGLDKTRVNEELNKVFHQFDYNRDNKLSYNEVIDFILSEPFWIVFFW